MKILLLNWIDHQNPQAGGAEIHLQNVFGRLVKKGHSVTLVTSGWPGSESRARVDGIEIHRVGSRYTLSALLPIYYRNNLRHNEFDLVLEDLNKVPFFSPLWTNLPVTLLVHHLFGTSAYGGASFPVATLSCLLEVPIPLVYRGVPTIAVSESTADDLTRRGMKRGQISVIPNGIEFETFTPGPHSDRYTKPTLLYLGRLKAYKKVEFILEAIALLSSKGVDCRLLVAGDGDYRGHLERLSKDLGINSRVTFLGYVTETKKIELLRKAWLHILTSSKEGWGITNLEAAACETPTVASDSPGLRDSVVHGRTGFLVPHGNIEALADRINELLENNELRQNMGKNSRKFAESFSWEESAVQIERFLEDWVVRSQNNS
jgi:glycosyltransferase involved in cell wall biosynthesis